MFIHSLSPEILPEPISAAAGAERTARHLRLLAELAEIGMELARDVRRQALEPDAERMDAAAGDAGENVAGAGVRADLGLVFARIARAVCRYHFTACILSFGTPSPWA